MDSYDARIQDVADEIEVWMEDYEEDEPEGAEDMKIFCQEGLIDPLNSLADILREAENIAHPQLGNLVEQVDNIFNKTISWAHGGDQVSPNSGSGPYRYDTCMPSFAHQNGTAPLLKDSRKTAMSHSFAGSMLPQLDSFAELFAEFGDNNIGEVKARMKEFFANGLKAAVPWRKTIRPHPQSTPCSRFMDDIPEWTTTDQNQRATSVFQARCDIHSRDIRIPTDMHLSSNGNILAFSSMGGWKNRIPYLSYHLPNEETSDDALKCYAIKVDLLEVFRHMLIDDERRLVFASDGYRTKSYRCKEPNVPKNGAGGRTLPVHTMASRDYSGPLTMLPGGRLAKAGIGSVAIWGLESLETHGESGKDLVGGPSWEKDPDTWRDDPQDIERSTGSSPRTTITLPSIPGKDDNDSDDKFIIRRWHQHPSQANILLCASDPEYNNYLCHALDFATECKTVARYLGHGDRIEGFSTSSADPNVFLTSCADGYARLYDVRHPLPVMTFATSREPEVMPAAVLAHPDGIPFVFTGAQISEHIKLWDVRARAFVYELATGNNQVEAMAWDANSNSLYAATSCSHLHDQGGYRLARIPRYEGRSNDLSDDEDDSGKGDDIEEEDESICWPQRAYHAEHHFGYAFDAGSHRLYKYSFKMDADPEVVPYYGSATLQSRNQHW